MEGLSDTNGDESSEDDIQTNLVTPPRPKRGRVVHISSSKVKQKRLKRQLFPQICQNSILGVPIKNKQVKGGGPQYTWCLFQQKINT